MPLKEKIAVIGCGSTGMATAAWLTEREFDVTLCDTREQTEDFAAIRQQGGIYVEGVFYSENPFLPHGMTNDFGEAVADVNVVLVCVSAQRHPEVLELLSIHVCDGQLVLLVPGNMGSVLFKRKLREMGKHNVMVAEMSGNLWACRHTAPGRVLVAMPPAAKYIAACPAEDNGAAIRLLDGVLEVLPATNIIEATLNSPNIISHVAGSILNAVGIEKKGEAFALFMDGLSESYIVCTNKVEAERNELLERMGLRVLGEPCERLHRSLMQDIVPPGLLHFKALKGPSSFNHRYVTEDASCGLALMVSLARFCGTSARFSESCLAIASEINGTDYLRTGCTIENLDIHTMLHTAAKK